MKNRSAFLQMIAVSEGTAKTGDDGYNVLVGSLPGKSLLFHDYSKHPNIKVRLSPTLVSTAAGRYQFIIKTWKRMATKLGLKDFSPSSQDRACLELINEAGALPDVDAGRFDSAVRKCRRIWASLPGAGYGQRENSLARLRTVFVGAGGKLA
jgi:muramidase (phage lysozyme)